jgi:hypothetical protein
MASSGERSAQEPTARMSAALILSARRMPAL